LPSVSLALTSAAPNSAEAAGSAPASARSGAAEAAPKAATPRPTAASAPRSAGAAPKAATPGRTATPRPTPPSTPRWSAYTDRDQAGTWDGEWQHKGIAPERLKNTQLCEFFYGQQGERGCLRPTTCTFAHSLWELMPPPIGLDRAHSDYPKAYVESPVTALTPTFKVAWANERALPKGVPETLKRAVEYSRAPAPPSGAPPRGRSRPPVPDPSMPSPRPILRRRWATGTSPSRTGETPLQERRVRFPQGSLEPPLRRRRPRRARRRKRRHRLSQRLHTSADQCRHQLAQCGCQP